MYQDSFKKGDLIILVEPNTENKFLPTRFTVIEIGSEKLPTHAFVPVCDVVKVLQSYREKTVKIIHV